MGVNKPLSYDEIVGTIMSLNLNENEINLLLSAVGLALNVIADPEARTELEALQTKLMAARK